MNIALVLAGGTGTRLGTDIPKQYLKVKDKMIITYCLETFLRSEYVDAIVVVADSMWQDEICNDMKKVVSGSKHSKFRGFSFPGANRQMSIYNGLESILRFAERESRVLIHDAARPLISEKTIEACFNAFEGHDGVMPVLPMKDTVYMSEDGKRVTGLLQREKIFAGQSPELFHLGKYYDACKDLLPDEIMRINGSTEPAIVAGMDVVMVPGDEDNFKITTSADMERFCDLVNELAM